MKIIKIRLVEFIPQKKIHKNIYKEKKTHELYKKFSKHNFLK